MSVLEDLVEKLNAFDTPNGVAEFLCTFGVKGELQNAESCIISSWIMAQIDCSGVLTSDQIDVYFDEDWTRTNSVRFDISKPVLQFIERFDQGCYPDLVDEASERICNCSDCFDYRSMYND